MWAAKKIEKGHGELGRTVFVLIVVYPEGIAAISPGSHSAPGD
jgi:hypothetical protein